MSRSAHALIGALAVAATSAAALCGCVVGPDYKGPPPVALESAGGRGFIRAGANAPPAPPAERWWLALNDRTLNQLEDRALHDAPDLAIATARLREARAGLRLRQADRSPETGVVANYLRRQDGAGEFRGPAAAALKSLAGAYHPTDTLQLYDAGFDAAWEPDLFGGKARAVEGAAAAAQAAEFSLQDAEVSLTAEVAQAYLQLRAAQARLAHLNRTLAIETQLLALTSKRQSEGAATDLDVERLNNQLQSARTGTSALEAEAAAQMDRLAMLVGAAPGALDGELQSPAAIPLPPAAVAVGDPAALLRRRPDIRAAERRIAQQNALVGVRTADLFPKVSLVGEIGFGSTDLGGVLSATGLSYTVAPVLHWSPLDFGRTRARIGQAEAGRDEAVASYRETVLAALDDAETTLSRYGHQAQTLAGLMQVKASAERLVHLTDLRWRGGTATSLDVVEAERRRVEADADVVAAEALLTQDYVSLQKSLGLGWGTVPPKAPPPAPR